MILQITKTKSIKIFHHVPELLIGLSIKHLATMLKSGLDLAESLEILSNQNSDPLLTAAYKDIVINVRAGNTLSSSMKKFPAVFDDIIVSIVDIGERGATLEKNLLYLADYLKQNYEINRKIKGALIYPALVLCFTVIEMLGVAFFILPKLEELFATFDSPPRATIIIINSGRWLRENIVYLGIGLLVFIIILKQFFKSHAGKRFKDRMVLKMPIFKNLSRNNLIASFSRTLGILMESSIPISEALQITADTTVNHVYKNAIAQACVYIKEGHNLAESLTKYGAKYFPDTYLKMIEIGETTGTLESNLQYLHEFYIEEVKDITNNLTTLLEPLLMIVIGLCIGGLALTIILPIFQMVGSIKA